MMAVRSLSVRPGAAARGDTAPLPAARATTHASSPGLRRQDAPTSSSASSRVRALLLARRAGVAAAAAAVAAAVHPHQLLRTLTGGGGAGGSGAGGGSGGSGGGGGGHGRWFGEQAAWAESDYFDEDDDDSRRGPKAPGTPAASSPDDEEKFLCEAVKANNLPTGPGIPSKAELFDGLHCKPGAMVSRSELQDDLSQLLSSGLFQNVDANVAPGSGGGYTVEFAFREKVWPPMMAFKVAGSTILPPGVEEEVLAEARKSKYTTVRVLAAAKRIVESYYNEKGLSFGTISHFDGMETGQVLAHIIEGQISRVSLQYVQGDGTVQPRGATASRVVYRELPKTLAPGNLYSVHDAKQALRDVFATSLFDNVQVVPRPDEADQSKVVVDIVLRERPLKTAEAELEWGIAPGEGGRPDLVSLIPGGSVFVEHRNLDGQARQVSASVSTANFLAPADDLGVKVEYTRPYVFGEKDPQKTALKVTAFNSRKLSPAFSGGPLSDEVPAVWVDRSGVKAAVTETFTRQSKCSYGLVLQEVNTRDEQGQACAAGAKALPNGMLDTDGPPTGHSGTGRDRTLIGQANVTRDTTYFLNGALVGARDLFTVDQALFSGTGFPVYNRHTASCTRFLQLSGVSRKSAAPPFVLVLHARYGGCIGNLASYDAFTLGGPHSCRGYSVGELGVARRFAEGAIELRVPVPKLNTHAFAFFEHCTDLGSSKDVPGNPTAYYRRAGAGSCSGVGLKLGSVRAEWVQDRNQGTGNLFVRFGERF